MTHVPAQTARSYERGHTPTLEGEGGDKGATDEWVSSSLVLVGGGTNEEHLFDRALSYRFTRPPTNVRLFRSGLGLASGGEHPPCSPVRPFPHGDLSA